MRIAVKQLEWPPECPRGQRVRSRPNALIRYAIAHYGPDGVSGGTIYRWASEGGKWSEPFKTYDAAKHAAQGDYRDRVLTEISVDGDDASDALEPFVEAWNLAAATLDRSSVSLGDIEALAKHYLKGGSIHRAFRAARSLPEEDNG